MIPLSRLIPDNQGIRTTVDKKRKEWPGFVASIGADGVKQSIIVRRAPADYQATPDSPCETADGIERFIIINGFHRTEAAIEALGIRNAELKARGQAQVSLDEVLIPAIIHDTTDKIEILELQLKLNSHTIATRPIQYSEQLQRLMMASNYKVTISELSEMVKMSPAWVSNMLKLKDLTEEASNAVASGDITAANAFHLARLDSDDQEHFTERAGMMNNSEFSHTVGTYIAEKRKKARGEKTDPNVFVPTAKIRTKIQVLEAHNKWYEEHLRSVPEEAAAGANRNSLEYMLGYLEALRFVLNLDPASVQEQESAFRADLAERLRKRQEKGIDKDAETAAAKGVGVFGSKIATDLIGVA